MKQYAIYLRVSTQKQGKSMLGIEAQRKMCEDFVSVNNGEILQEFMDIESGTHRNRKGLQDAILFCKAHSCPLVIAKLDRLARDVEFCFKVINTGIEIHFTDMPQINTLLLGVFASVAQYERELTSDRTKKALAVKKAQGAKLGASNPNYIATRASKTEETLQKEQEKRGKTKSQHYLQAQDQQVFIRVLRNVFPLATKSDNLMMWRWGFIDCKKRNRKKMLSLMSDYKGLDKDGTLFVKWDFNDEQASGKKLASYMQAFKKSCLKELK